MQSYHIELILVYVYRFIFFFILDISVNFNSSPSWVGSTYETMFKFDTNHLHVSLTSVNVFGMKLQRYPIKHSQSDYIEILLDFHDGSLMTTNISMNIMGRPKVLVTFTFLLPFEVISQVWVTKIQVVYLLTTLCHNSVSQCF